MVNKKQQVAIYGSMLKVYSLIGIEFQRSCNIVAKISLCSVKVEKYLCGMSKTIKIPNPVHKELKLFSVSRDNENMEDIAGFAIMEYLQSKGHKFLKPQPKTKK